MSWQEVRRAVADLVVARQEAWLGLRVGPERIGVAISRRGDHLELIAGVCRTGHALAGRLLELARDLDAGGLVTEDGAYLLKELVPFDDRAATLIRAAVLRLANATVRLRAGVLTGAPGDLFANFLR